MCPLIVKNIILQSRPLNPFIGVPNKRLYTIPALKQQLCPNPKERGFKDPKLNGRVLLSVLGGFIFTSFDCLIHCRFNALEYLQDIAYVYK